MKTQQTRSPANSVKGSKFPKVVANKKIEKNNGYNFSSSVGIKNNINSELKTHFQLIPLTKADNITINLSVSPIRINENKINKENLDVPKIIHEKSDSLQLVSNNQSFTCVLSALITTFEVNINVNFKLHGSDISEKPILSLYSDFGSTSYNILATALGQQLHIQQQHLQSGNATNVKFICPTGALALEWADFINAPHKLTIDTTIDASPRSLKQGASPRSPVRFTPVSQFNSTAGSDSHPIPIKPLLSPISQSTSPILDASEGTLTATPPQGLLSFQQIGSPRRRSQSSQEASRAARIVIPTISASEGELTPTHHPAASRQHDLLKASLRPLPSAGDREAVNRSRHSQSEDVTTSSQFRPAPREHSFSADVATDQFGSLTQANLQRLNVAEGDETFVAAEARPASSRPQGLAEKWAEDINKVRAEIESTEQQYRQEEASICAAEEASLKESINTVYSSLLHQGLLPSELAAEQAKVKVWEGVQRKKNDRKSVQRLSIIAEELSGMRREADELIRKLQADIDREGVREAEERQQSQDQYTKIVEENMGAIAANKLRVQEESDRLRAEMSAAERRVKEEALRRNQEEETKLQQTVGSVYASLLVNQELSPAELLLEQDKVHVWENLQRAKLSKSVKARRKATGKEVTRVLDLGREAIKQLMLTAEEHNHRLLLDIQAAEKMWQSRTAGEEQSVDDVVKFRTYTDLSTLDGRQIPKHISSAASATSAVNTATAEAQHSVQHEAVEQQQKARQREEQTVQLRAAILSVQSDTAAQEQRLVQEENSLCVEETAGLTASVGAVYTSLLHQGLNADQLLNEQEKVAVWEAIQRRKQQKQAMRRKAALKTRLQDVRQAGDDQVRTLTLQLEGLLSGWHSTEPDSISMTPLADCETDSPLERRMRAYSQAQYELHSATQRELHDKQQAVQQQIAERRAAILLEDQQRLEAQQAEADRKELLELERLEAVRLTAEQQREESERGIMEVADEEDQRRTRSERALLQEVLRLRQARVAGLARKVCHRMATRIQAGYRSYRSRVFLHAHATRIQRHMRGHLVTRRIARHFRTAIAQIEDQSARAITTALKAYVSRRRAKFKGWDILHELVVVSVLRFALQRREILLLSRRIAVNRRKKESLALSRQQRADRKEKEKEREKERAFQQQQQQQQQSHTSADVST